MPSLRGALMPVGATLAIQSLMSMATVTLPVLAPAASHDIGAPAAWVGLFVALVYGTSMACGLASGALVRRLGALRLSQLCLVIGGAGLVMISTGRLGWVACGALLLGCGYGPVTPASSHLLTRTAPPQHLSIIFSFKQTGVPLGSVLAGSLLPLIVLWGGWRAAALCVALASLALALALQPLRAALDSDRTPSARIGIGSLAEPARLVASDRAGRPLALSSFFFASLQLCLGTYLVTYLTQERGFDLVRAGLALAAAQGAGIVARLIAGVLADRSGRPAHVMGALGCMMGVCAMATPFTGDWPTAALLLLYTAFGASAIGWNGVYLAEVARRAPPGAISAATGAALFVTYSGILAGPAVFALLVQTGSSYGKAFAVVAAPALLCGLYLLHASPRPVR
jgi:MFS family permease